MRINTRVAIAAFLLLLIVGLGLTVKPAWRWINTQIKEEQTARLSRLPPMAANAVPPSPDEIDIPIHPMVELDFKTREQIFALRTAEIDRVSELRPARYVPSPEVFSQMEDGRPWWGIEGLYFRGGTPDSILGVSEQSRSLLNPYMLVGVREWHAFNTQLPIPAGVTYYANPIQLRWQKHKNQAVGRYNLSQHAEFVSTHPFPDMESRTFTLMAYNARDLGYTYAQVDPANLHNVSLTSPGAGPVPIFHMIHNGQSCGYPGGCNNASPDQAELRIQVDALPARIAVKLWRLRPSALDAPPDMLFILEMI